MKIHSIKNSGQNRFQCPTLRYITLRCIALHCIALHCIALHCTYLYIVCISIYIGSRGGPRGSSFKSQSSNKSSPKAQAQVEAMKKVFIAKLQQKSSLPSTPKKSITAAVVKKEVITEMAIDDQPDLLGTLGQDIMTMEKVDLLVHVQKIQLMLDQERCKREAMERQVSQNASFDKDLVLDELEDLREANKHLRLQIQDQKEVISKVRQDYLEKEAECKKWIGKIEQSNDIVDELVTKDHELERMKSEVEMEVDKRKQIESMFQDITEKEMKVQGQLHKAHRELEALKVLF
jgi:hypothetical protein